MEQRELSLRASRSAGDVAALVIRPGAAFAALALGHGAGAGMRHPFMSALAERLADRGIGTLRYEFPYMSRGSRRPDPPPILMATVRSAATAAAEVFGTLPLFAGGKSMGGRMTSGAAAQEALPNVHGIVFYGFPLHAPGKPPAGRADHLSTVQVPMLFLQGTRDSLARTDLLEPVCRMLGPRATLHVVDGADHGFHVLRRSGRTDDDVLDELADTTAAWVRGLAE